MTVFRGQSYRIAVGPQVFTLQPLPAGDEPFGDSVGQGGRVFARQAGVAARADERRKLDRLCRTISRAAVSQKR